MSAGRRFSVAMGVLLVMLWLFSPRISADSPSAPKGVRVDLTHAGIRIGWEEVDEGEFFRIYRRINGEELCIGQTKAHYFVDRNAPGGVGISYAVVTLDENGAESPKRWHNTAYLSAPVVSVCEVTAGYGISWEKVEGAEDYILRKYTDGGWELLARTENLGYTDSHADPEEEYLYSVTAVMGGVSSKTVTARAVPEDGIPAFPGYAPEGFEVTVAGKSGLGNEIYLYTYGEGENVLFLTFGIHGWEDGFAADGRAHAFTAFRLMDGISALSPEDWRVYIIPLANPDGLIHGNDNHGTGRCTAMMFDRGWHLVEGGVDINRCFPALWEKYYYGRNQNGDMPLACPEAVVIASLMEEVRGAGRNVFIDVHGWTEQTITAAPWNGVHLLFVWEFYSNTWANLNTAEGYAATYANSLGYEACLFEFPYRHSSLSSFISSRLPDRFVSCVLDLFEE